MKHILTPFKNGDKWLPGMEKIARWGGYIGAEGKEILERELAAGRVSEAEGGWVHSDYVTLGVFSCREHLWFAPPEDIWQEVYGPKFNEYGEIAP